MAMHAGAASSLRVGRSMPGSVLFLWCGRCAWNAGTWLFLNCSGSRHACVVARTSTLHAIADSTDSRRAAEQFRARV